MRGVAPTSALGIRRSPSCQSHQAPVPARKTKPCPYRDRLQSMPRAVGHGIFSPRNQPRKCSRNGQQEGDHTNNGGGPGQRRSEKTDPGRHAARAPKPTRIQATTPATPNNIPTNGLTLYFAPGEASYASLARYGKKIPARSASRKAEPASEGNAQCQGNPAWHQVVTKDGRDACQ